MRDAQNRGLLAAEGGGGKGHCAMLPLSLRVLLHHYHAARGLWHHRRRCHCLVLMELVLE